MNERNCALAIGIVFLVLGIAGFIPGLVSVPPAGTELGLPVGPHIPPYTKGFGYLSGLFPVNFMHDLVHLTVGIFGIAAFAKVQTARWFNRIFAVSYLLIAVMGLLPLTKTTFGLMPIFGNNVWFNALTAVIAAYYGFVKPVQEEPTGIEA